jgi:pyrroline-5-carboxylate reductase
MPIHLALIGAGNMSEAIARGLLRSNVFRADELAASDPSSERKAVFERELKIRVVDSNIDAARDAPIILLAVKPQKMPEALESLRTALDVNRVLLISIAAGDQHRLDPCAAWERSAVADHSRDAEHADAGRRGSHCNLAERSCDAR